MDECRGMKLVRKFVDKTQAVNLGVYFDKTKHLSEVQIQRRERVRKRLIAKLEAEEKEKLMQKKLELHKLESERFDQMFEILFFEKLSFLGALLLQRRRSKLQNVSVLFVLCQ